MTAEQLPGAVREFANHLDGLLARLDPSGGWCAVFWRRDPEAMRACLDGREVPPWDVVDSLLSDLAAGHGPGAAARETARMRALHTAALRARDSVPGARAALHHRLEALLGAQRAAAERRAALARGLAAAPTRDVADALARDLAWAEDDHERASARCAELRARITDAEAHGGAEPVAADACGDDRDGSGGAAGAPRPSRSGPNRTADASGHGRGARAGSAQAQPRAARDAPVEAAAAYPGGRDRSAGSAGVPAHGPGQPGGDGGVFPRHPGAPDARAGDGARGPSAGAVRGARPRKRRRGGARFAGSVEEEGGSAAVPDAAGPGLAGPGFPAPAPAAALTPRGARFAGAVDDAAGPVRGAGAEVPAGMPETGASVPAGVREEAGEVVAALARLRGQGRGGQAHVLLAEAAQGDPTRLPAFAEELHRAGLDADWQTLLWEAACLPAVRLVAVADALTAAGRAEDGRQVLRQGVARPPGEIGGAVLGLLDDGRDREARALLDAYVRARPPEEAARSAEPGPRRLVPLLLQAARAVSDRRGRDIAHALRAAGPPP
ncbi:hypothetical protein [Streptomyces sp. AHA2]|uniref:hypothetical protein n=1 Tax=Streptomyces sp. AHA2 TaxID=3064526 RepID=UPI002FDF85FC